MSDPNCYGIMYSGQWLQAVTICTSWTLDERPAKDWSVYLKYQFQHEIIPQLGKFCKDHDDKTEICDGTRSDCVKKGKEICLSDSNCYGIMYKSGWVSTYKGIKMCSSWTLQAKSEKDWSVFLKCSNGKYKCQSIINMYLE